MRLFPVYGADRTTFDVAAVAHRLQLESGGVVIGPDEADGRGIIGPDHVPEGGDRLLEILVIEGWPLEDQHLAGRQVEDLEPLGQLHVGVSESQQPGSGFFDRCLLERFAATRTLELRDGVLTELEVGQF